MSDSPAPQDEDTYIHGCVEDDCERPGDVWQNKEWMCTEHARAWSRAYECGTAEELDALAPDLDEPESDGL